MKPKTQRTKRHHSGQMLLITLLVLTVATTIALSLIGRATLDLSMTNQLEESARAFDAAEAGVESALQTGNPAHVALANGVTFDVNVDHIGGNGVYEVSHKTSAGSSETLWLQHHNSQGGLDFSALTKDYTAPTLNICWDNAAAAISMNVLYVDNTGTYKVARMTADANKVSHKNNFGLPTALSDGCGLTGRLSKQINFINDLGIHNETAGTDTLLAVRIRPEYADTTIATDGIIPQQGNVIESTGTTGSGVARKVVVYQQYRTASSVFDYVIYSQQLFEH